MSRHEPQTTEPAADTIAKLLWIIHVARKDLREGAPDRAMRFLDHQMKEFGYAD